MLDDVRKRHEGRTHRTSAGDAALFFQLLLGLKGTESFWMTRWEVVLAISLLLALVIWLNQR